MKSKNTSLTVAFCGFRLLRNAYFHAGIIVIYLVNQGFSIADVLLLESIYYLARCVSDIPTGYIADKFSRKACLVASSIIAAVSYSGFYLFPEFWFLAVLQVFLGVAISLSQGADSALVYDALGHRKMSDQYQAVEGYGWGMNRLGIFFAAIATSFITAIWGMAMPFLFTAGFVGASVVFALWLPSDRSYRGTHRSRPRIDWSQLRHLAVGDGVVVIAFVVLFSIAIRVGAWALQPILIELDTPEAWYGPIFAATLLTASLAAFGTKKTSKLPAGIGVVAVFISFMAFLAMTIWGISVAGLAGITLVTIGFCVHGVAHGLYEPLVRDIVNRKTVDSTRATALSIVSTLGNLGFSAIAPLFGRALDGFGSASVFSGVALFVATWPVLLWLGLRIVRKVPATSESL